jgi:peptide/nickel transport system permease protein
MIAYLILVAFFFILINLVIDIAYIGLDPRLRKARA